MRGYFFIILNFFWTKQGFQDVTPHNNDQAALGHYIRVFKDKKVTISKKNFNKKRYICYTTVVFVWSAKSFYSHTCLVGTGFMMCQNAGSRFSRFSENSDHPGSEGVMEIWHRAQWLSKSEMTGKMDGWMYGWMDGWIGWMDGWMGG